MQRVIGLLLFAGRAAAFSMEPACECAPSPPPLTKDKRFYTHQLQLQESVYLKSGALEKFRAAFSEFLKKAGEWDEIDSIISSKVNDTFLQQFYIYKNYAGYEARADDRAAFHATIRPLLSKAPTEYLGFMKTDIRHPVPCVGFAPDIPDSKKQVLSLVTAFVVPGKFSEFDSTALPILHEQQGWNGLSSLSTSTKDYENVQQVQIYANMSMFLALNEARGRTLPKYGRYFTAPPLYDVSYIETDIKWGCKYNCLWGDFRCEYGLPIGKDAETWNPL